MKSFQSLRKALWSHAYEIIHYVIGEQARHSQVAQLKIGDICLFIYTCVDVHMLFCTLTLTFLGLLCGLALPIPPLNRIFWFSDPVSFNEINYLPLCIRLFLNATIRT